MSGPSDFAKRGAEGAGRRASSTLAMTAALFGLAGVVLAPSAEAASKDDRVFTVGNYPLEARADNAVAAKERAIADGQQAAFRSLLKRIVPVTAYSRLSRVRAAKPGDLIEGFSVRSESNSSTEYIASYDFVFQAETVRRILDNENIPFFDRQAPQIAILPIYRAPPNAPASEAYSDARGSDSWLYAWKGLDLVNSLTPATLVSAKKPLSPQVVQGLVSGDAEALRALSEEYRAPALLVVLLEPDLAAKRLRVTLAGRDAVAPFVLQRAYRFDGRDFAYTSEFAAVVSLGILEGRWKAINVRGSAAPMPVSHHSASSPSASGYPGPAGAYSPPPVTRPGEEAEGGPLKVAIEFRGMGEWQQISRQLSQTPELTDLDVEGLSARGARVSFRYPGGPQRLAATLAQQGLVLRNTGSGWLLTPRDAGRP